jgi:hypothetical protein
MIARVIPLRRDDTRIAVVDYRELAVKLAAALELERLERSKERSSHGLETTVLTVALGASLLALLASLWGLL